MSSLICCAFSYVRMNFLSLFFLSIGLDKPDGVHGTINILMCVYVITCIFGNRSLRALFYAQNLVDRLCIIKPPHRQGMLVCEAVSLIVKQEKFRQLLPDAEAPDPSVWQRAAENGHRWK